MAHRDEHGHFITAEEAGRREPTGDTPDTPAGGTGGEDAAETPRRWAEGEGGERETVIVDTGRGGTAEVQVGCPFVPTLERLAEEANYGGYFRIFLNGSEVVNPEEAPQTIEREMRIIITSYDKVGK